MDSQAQILLRNITIDVCPCKDSIPVSSRSFPFLFLFPFSIAIVPLQAHLSFRFHLLFWRWASCCCCCRCFCCCCCCCSSIPFMTFLATARLWLSCSSPSLPRPALTYAAQVSNLFLSLLRTKCQQEAIKRLFATLSQLAARTYVRSCVPE